MAPFLFGIDLEDVRLRMPDGHRRPPRVPELAARYLDFLRRHGARGTFVGSSRVDLQACKLEYSIVSPK